jgi:hypothetical protein
MPFPGLRTTEVFALRRGIFFHSPNGDINVVVAVVSILVNMKPGMVVKGGVAMLHGTDS